MSCSDLVNLSTSALGYWLENPEYVPSSVVGRTTLEMDTSYTWLEVNFGCDCSGCESTSQGGTNRRLEEWSYEVAAPHEIRRLYHQVHEGQSSDTNARFAQKQTYAVRETSITGGRHLLGYYGGFGYGYDYDDGCIEDCDGNACSGFA